MSVPQPPPPPPPPLPLNSNSNSTLSTTSLSSKSHIYSSPNNIDYSFQQFNNHKTTNGVQISASNDTLVQDESNSTGQATGSYWSSTSSIGTLQ